MSYTLTTSGAIIRKAGSAASATIIADATALANWSDQAEAVICTLTRYNWTSNYASVSASFKPMLDDAASDYAAMRVISYDMSGYSSAYEAQVVLDILHDNFNRIISALKDKPVQEVMV